ncbi:hypothetical protein C8Q75DRAFT_140729 [Abortiporus biennis]|nr:hypothetical protein C8Q75DRAFT_140729 [Abortiporus biennis]
MSYSPTGNVAFPGLKLDNTLGALFVGIFIAASLTGIGFLQTFIYLMNSGRKDRILFQGLIVFLCILDVLQSILSVVGEYHYVVGNFANPIALLSIFWTFPSFLIITVVMDFFVRCIFIHRFWALSNMRLIPIFLMILNIMTVAFVIGVKYAQIGYFLEMATVKWELITQLTLIAVTDTLIAVFLCVLLWQRKTHVISKHIGTQINVLMAYTLQTGALTSLLSIAVLATYLAWSDDLIYTAVYVIFPKVYHNALLGSLNGRGWMRATPDNTKGYNSIHLSSIAQSGSTLAASSSDIQRKEISNLQTGLNNPSAFGDIESIGKFKI